jgi:uncharacterized membrane protein
MLDLLSQATADVAEDVPGFFPITDPGGLLAILLAVLAVIFYLANHPVTGRFFKIIPSLVFCYFVPTLLTTLGVIPHESALYTWIKDSVLPAALLLLILALDVPGIIRLGPKAGIMLLAGTVGVVIGGPISLLIMHPWLPDDIWKGMTALCGSWIGGGANFVALGQMAEITDEMLAMMVIPDVFVANIWMGILLYLSGRQHRIDAWTGANATAIRDLERRMAEFEKRTARIPTLANLLTILALGFGISWLAIEFGNLLPELGVRAGKAIISHDVWKYILVTTVGLVLSFTRARSLEGVGASKVGSVMLYLLVACIGAHADFRAIVEAPELIIMGLIWIAVHIIVLLGVGKLIRAPIFFVAVGSQANIGGAASAPIVASAFHPSLAPVGVLLAVAGYVLGTYAGGLCMVMLRTIAETS